VALRAIRLDVTSRLAHGFPRCIAVGLASPTAALHKLAGCDLKSWGYHGDDGQVRNGNAPNKDYGPGFTSADVIGCVYRRADASVHFTKNGKYLGK